MSTIATVALGILAGAILATIILTPPAIAVFACEV
jgi:hypothetical protein